MIIRVVGVGIQYIRLDKINDEGREDCILHNNCN